MANIRVDIPIPIKNGSEVVFRSPCDCSNITGLKVYYVANTGEVLSQEFKFADAHKTDVTNISELFAEDAVVKVILDIVNNMAFVQNADTNAYLEGRFDELKKSVSDGKAKVANAITNKGVETATDSTFQVLTDNVSKIVTLPEGTSDGTALAKYIVKGYTAYVKGTKLTGVLPNRSHVSHGAEGVVGLEAETYPNVAVSPYDGAVHWRTNTDGVKRFCLQAPYGVYGGAGNKGGLSGDGYVGFPVSEFGNAEALDVVPGKTFTSKDGLKITGTMKEKLFATKFSGMTIPYPKNLVIIYDGKIYIFYSSSGSASVASWNGTITSNVITAPPYKYYSMGQAVVYNNEIHLLTVCKTSDSSDGIFHYKWNGSAWSQVCEMINDGSGYGNDHRGGDAVVYNNEIHLLGFSAGNYGTKWHKWNGSAWSSPGVLPYAYSYAAGDVVVYNNEIHVLGFTLSDTKLYHYKWNGSAWTQVSTLPISMANGIAIVHNNKIYIFPNNAGYQYGYMWNGSAWSKVDGLLTGVVLTGGCVVYNNKIHIVKSGAIYRLDTVYSKE